MLYSDDAMPDHARTQYLLFQDLPSILASYFLLSHCGVNFRQVTGHIQSGNLITGFGVGDRI